MSLRSEIIDIVRSLGFADVRFARAEVMETERLRLREWLDRGFHGEMSYMENHFDKRTDPTKLLEGTKTVICLAFNYYTDKKQEDKTAPQLSMYALGRDYHKVIKGKLKALLKQLQVIDPSIEGRGFVDSAPVLERDWARRSGLGWIGKNTLLIHPRRGSYYFLAELLINKEIEPDSPIDDYCGTCTKCIDACPTDAILEDGYVMDGSKCISYLTIELKGEIPKKFEDKMENWMYGCDICQQVCPWNRFSSEHDEDDFIPSEALLKMTKEEWHELTDERFEELFRGSAVKRTQFKGLKRNIEFVDQ